MIQPHHVRVVYTSEQIACGQQRLRSCVPTPRNKHVLQSLQFTPAFVCTCHMCHTLFPGVGTANNASPAPRFTTPLFPQALGAQSARSPGQLPRRHRHRHHHHPPRRAARRASGSVTLFPRTTSSTPPSPSERTSPLKFNDLITAQSCKENHKTIPWFARISKAIRCRL